VQSWRVRLAELRALVRENGERLDAELRDGYRREHDGAWWAGFCHAAEAGDEIPLAVWRSAERFVAGDTGRSGWVQRLKVRHAARRFSMVAAQVPPGECRNRGGGTEHDDQHERPRGDEVRDDAGAG
jgi:hypothetical protein